MMNNKDIEPFKGCLIIGEVAQAHDGSLQMAHSYIDAIADAGAGAVKFQTHIAAAESTPEEPWRVKFSQQDARRYDYWKRMEFTEEQWAGLKKHADDRGLKFLSSPFSIEALELLLRVGVSAWKVASGEVETAPMLDKMIDSKLPIILSTGMSSITEIDNAAQKVKQAGSALAVLQCTSMYPTPPENVGLNMLRFYRERYGCAVGLSDHTGDIYSSLAAAALGANILEVHITLSRHINLPDNDSSITVDQLRSLVKGVRDIERMNANPVDKDLVANELSSLKKIFSKSVVLKCDLPAGSVLTGEYLTIKKPGTGIPAVNLSEVIGRKLKRDLRADHILLEADLE